MIVWQSTVLEERKGKKLFISFLKQRRSVTAKKMVPGKVDEKHLQQILEAGLILE